MNSAHATVRDLADTLRASIEGGAYLPGRIMSVGQMAVDAGVPTERHDEVRRALGCLAAEGILALTPLGRVRISSHTEAVERPVLIASWVRELIQQGVYLPGKPLPERYGLYLSLVSPERRVTAALQQLHEEQVILLRQGKRPIVRTELPFAVESPPDLDSLLDRVPRMEQPDGVDLSFGGIRRACAATHRWWQGRNPPPPQEVARMHRSLAVVATYLIPWVGDEQPSCPDVTTVLRRTAVTAAAPLPPDLYHLVWRTACLGAGVREVLQLTRTGA